MAFAASGRSRKVRHHQTIDLLPVMNLFCCIIPFLLLSASFLQITTISMSQTEGISQGAGAMANLARSEEDRLQPKIIITSQEMFLGTTAGTIHICYSIRQQENGETVLTYDFDSLRVKTEEVYKILTETYPQIDFRKVTILTEPRIQYNIIVNVIDICAMIGFDQPGLQVAPPEAFLGAFTGGGS